MIKLGCSVKGSKVYGSYNQLTGTVTKIEFSGWGEGWDILTVDWDDGQVAHFYRRHF